MSDESEQQQEEVECNSCEKTFDRSEAETDTEKKTKKVQGYIVSESYGPHGNKKPGDRTPTRFNSVSFQDYIICPHCGEKNKNGPKEMY